MELPVTALLAAAIHEARFGVEDPAGMDLILSLLTRATGGAAVRLEVSGEELLVNSTRIPAVAPGASLVRDALSNHDTVRLRVPPGALGEQWRSIVTLYASAPGLYESIDDLRDALRATVPDVMVSNTRGRAAEADLRAALPNCLDCAQRNPGVSRHALPSRTMRRSHDSTASSIRCLRRRPELVRVALRSPGPRARSVARDRRVRGSGSPCDRRARTPADGAPRRARADGACDLQAGGAGDHRTHARQSRQRRRCGIAQCVERCAERARAPAYIDALVSCRDRDDAIVAALPTPNSSSHVTRRKLPAASISSARSRR